MRRVALAATLTLASLGAVAEVGAGAGARATKSAAVPTSPRPPDPVRRGAPECSGCHTQNRWSEVTFDHARTSFALRGAHAQASCRACHPTDFKTHVADSCAGCHRDRHAGDLGLHCEGCHEETTWRATLFAADGHRATAFPLRGKHAAIPCQDCHGNLRDRAFSRAPLPCVDCHRAAYDATAARSVDHAAAAFSTDCQGCHSTWRFAPARFDAHETCFRLAGGAHAGLRCQQCHSRVAGLAVTGSCRTQTVICASCHAHDCARSDAQHVGVMGYACASQKCFECHQQMVSP